MCIRDSFGGGQGPDKGQVGLVQGGVAVVQLGVGVHHRGGELKQMALGLLGVGTVDGQQLLPELLQQGQNLAVAAAVDF